MTGRLVSDDGGRREPPSPAGAEPPPSTAPQVCALWSSVFVLLNASIALIGVVLHMESLRSVAPHWPKMAVPSAVAFVMSGLSLWCARTSSHSSLRALGEPLTTGIVGRIQSALALGVLAIGLCILVTYGVHGLLSPDQWQTHFSSVNVPAIITPASAFNFTLVGGALFLAGRSRFVEIFQGLSLVFGLIGWLGFSRYLYSGEPLFLYGGMSIQTALGFVALSAGVLCIRTDGGLIALLTSRSDGGFLIRRLLPCAFLVPVIVGWLSLQGQHAGWYGREAGLSLFTLMIVLIMGTLIWIYAALLHATDAKRRMGEKRLQEQLSRLDLLRHITSAITERHDLGSIYQVVVSHLEEQLPVDLSSICHYAPDTRTLSVITLGSASTALGATIAVQVGAIIPIDQNGLSRCMQGTLVYESDIQDVPYPFPQRLASGGLRSFVAVPLLSTGAVFGMLLVACRATQGFSSPDCEFLRQLGDHLVLSVHQARLNQQLQQALDDLQRSQQAAMQQERLKALGQMASGIAHDINNAISPIGLYTEMLLKRETALSAKGHRQLEIINRAINDVAQTVARLGEFYRQRDPDAAPLGVDMNEVIHQVIELTRARWSDIPLQRGVVITATTELTVDLPLVIGIASEIREALINLVLNAVDAMPSGGTLTVRSQLIEGGPSGALIRVAVADTGIGMDEATRTRCLEPFFTTKGERGTGIGLAMVYGIAQRHGAEITIDSTVGRGTEMALVFARPAAAPGPDTATLAAMHHTPMRLLIIDDDPLLLTSLQDCLAAEGHTVIAADIGQKGIDAFRMAHGTEEEFEVVITDLGMPHLDGRDVAAAIKGISPTTPVILLTGWGRRLTADNDLPQHIDHILSKPPKLDEVRQTLTRLRSRQLSEARSEGGAPPGS